MYNYYQNKIQNVMIKYIFNIKKQVKYYYYQKIKRK